MAHVLLAILAALALVVSPIAASAAPMTCGMETSQAVVSGIAAVDGPSVDRHAAPAKPDSCCDKMPKGCAKSCSMFCAGGVAVLPAISSLVVFEGLMTPRPSKGAALRSHEPIGLDRPPKATV